MNTLVKCFKRSKKKGKAVIIRLNYEYKTCNFQTKQVVLIESDAEHCETANVILRQPKSLNASLKSFISDTGIFVESYS